MSPDALDGARLQQDLAERSLSAMAKPEPAAAALRELSLQREIARLTAERNRLLANLATHGLLAGDGRAAVAPYQETLYQMRLAAKDRVIRALYASTSWRMTAPLRRFINRLRAAPITDTDPDTAIRATDVMPFVMPADLAAAPGLDRVTRCHPDAHSQGQILVVADHLPLFDQQSGGLRLHSLIGMIADLGWSITFASHWPEAGPGCLATETGRASYEAALRQVGVTHFVYGLDAMRACLQQGGGSFRFALISFPKVAADVIPMVRLYCPWARVIFDTVDLHFLRTEREAAVTGSARLRDEAVRLRGVELACLTMADVTLAVTQDERALLLSLAPQAVVETLPNIFQSPARPPPGPQDRQGLLFVGGFWHRPNVDAVLWFAQEIWPLLRSQVPDLNFSIVGSNPSDTVLALDGRDGIAVIGQVADLTPYFNAARVCVAPLRFGAGMKGKVGQSMMAGLPVVTTMIGAEGLAAEDGCQIAIADDAAGFAAHVMMLLTDDIAWTGLQTEARALAEATLSTTALAPRINALFHV